MEKELTVPKWISAKWKTFSPIDAPLEGAWRLTGIWEYDNERNLWLVSSVDMWGPKDYLFEQDVVTIHTPSEVKSVHYDFIPGKRYVLFDEDAYYISKLSDSELVIHPTMKYGPMKFNFERIDPAQIHGKTDAPQLEPSDMLGLWWVDAEYELAEGAWELKTDCRTAPGMNFWKMSHWPIWKEFEFGRSPQDHGDAYRSLNKEYFIFRRYLGFQKSQFFHPVKDDQGYWAFVLDSMTGDYRDSRQKLHLTPIDPKTNDLFVKSMLWAESERRHKTAADKIPLELLEAWCIPNPEEMAKLLGEGKFIEQPELFRSNEYTGVYVFLHYFFISTKKYDKSLIVHTYLKFQEILSRWLDFYDGGTILKYIYPFFFKGYPEQLNTLMQSEPVHFNHRPITCGLLRKKLEELRIIAHHYYALIEHLPKEEFYIFHASGKGKWEENIYTLNEFLSQFESFPADDAVCINILLHKDQPEATIYLTDWIIYCHAIKNASDISLENFKRTLESLLELYCEKCLRNNEPFNLTPETIRHFGFTEDDVCELQPQIEQFHEEIKTRLWSKYQNLVQLDCIREMIAANASSEIK